MGCIQLTSSETVSLTRPVCGDERIKQTRSLPGAKAGAGTGRQVIGIESELNPIGFEEEDGQEAGDDHIGPNARLRLSCKTIRGA